MKKLILPALLVIAFIAGANATSRGTLINGAAYNNHSPGAVIVNSGKAIEDSLYSLDALKEKLDLTDEQIPVVDSILTAAMNKLNAVTDTGQGGMQQKQQIINDANTAIENILTDEQRTKFDAMKTQSGGTGY